jgi:acetoin utilization deacetylase AcuC-like enzyme
MPLTLVTSDRFADHLTPPGHPERVARAHVMQAVTEKWAAEGVAILAPRLATRAELLRVHTAAYLDHIRQTAGRAVMLDGDTFTSPDTADVAELAAGAAIVAVDAVLGDRAEASSAPTSLGDRAEASPVPATTTPDAGPRTPDPGRRTPDPGPRPPDPGRRTPDDSIPPSALVLVRPPGHHAEAARAMGFCIYNNTAIAAAHALARGRARVAVVDYDVHHGNGTQWAFYGDPRVLYVSTHQFPFYPGTGSAGEAGVGQGEGFTVNVPLEAGATDDDYLTVCGAVILPVLAAFRPELLLVSAGFDAHMRDPLAQMRMSVAGFNHLALRLHALAGSVGCPAVFITEGGYHLKVLGACLDGLVRVMLGPAFQQQGPGRSGPERVTGGPEAEPLTADDAPLVEQILDEPARRGQAAVDLVRAVQKRYWPGL